MTSPTELLGELTGSWAANGVCGTSACKADAPSLATAQAWCVGKNTASSRYALSETTAKTSGTFTCVKNGATVTGLSQVSVLLPLALVGALIAWGVKIYSGRRQFA